MVRNIAALLCLLAFSSCASVQFMGGQGGTIGTYWGSNTCCGANWSPVPTASAGANADH